MTIPPIDTVNFSAQKAALHRQTQLTKPEGALGQLEALAVQIAACQGSETPEIKTPWISVFAADHGITRAGISAFPAVVTQEMVKNFSRGGAAINVLARLHKAAFEVVDVGLLAELPAMSHLVKDRVRAGAHNSLESSAMTEAELNSAMQVGKRAVERAAHAQADLFIAGDMGIGNTTAATAIICQLCGMQQRVAELVGFGTGISVEQKEQKIKVVELLLQKHSMPTAQIVLQKVGGLEIAAMTGAYLWAAHYQLPIVVDGVIASAAALVAIEMEPACQAWMIFAHQSVEPAQQAVFTKINATPLLNLGMRLGEGSGAAVAIPIIQMACKLHNEMATFAEAAVSEKTEKA